MPLITPTDINTIAFITPIEETKFKTDNINLVENKVASTLGDFYNQVIDSPENYTELLTTYIKPYMAYAIKALTLNTILSDGGLSAEEINSYQTAIASANMTAKNHYSQLIKVLSSDYGITRKLMSGFIIK
jgi:hypothetical protein